MLISHHVHFGSFKLASSIHKVWCSSGFSTKPGTSKAFRGTFEGVKPYRCEQKAHHAAMPSLYCRSCPSRYADPLLAGVFNILNICITLTSPGRSSPWNCLSALDFLRLQFPDVQGDLELSGQGIFCNENGSPEFCANWRGQKQRSGQSSERAFILGYPLVFYRMESEATSKCW